MKRIIALGIVAVMALAFASVASAQNIECSSSGGPCSGTMQADNIHGSQTGDIIKGHAGNDTIGGNFGADFIRGQSGNDTIKSYTYLDNTNDPRDRDVVRCGPGGKDWVFAGKQDWVDRNCEHVVRLG